MSKFCQNCGSAMEDSEVFCANCGTQFEDAAAAPAADNKKKLIITIGGAVAALLVVVLLVSMIFGGGQKSAVQKYLNLDYKGRVGSMKSLAPEKYWKYVDDEYEIDVKDAKEGWKEDWKEDLEDTVESDGFEDAYGSKGKITYKYQDKKEATNDELKAAKAFLNSKYNIKKDDIDALYIVDYTFTRKGDEDKDVTTQSYYVVKIEGKWYPLNDSYDFAIDRIVRDYAED